MTPAERARRAAPCTMSRHRRDERDCTPAPGGIECCGCALRPAVEREIAEAVAAERARVLGLMEWMAWHETSCRAISYSPLEFGGCNCDGAKIRAAIESGAAEL